MSGSTSARIDIKEHVFLIKDDLFLCIFLSLLLTFLLLTIVNYFTRIKKDKLTIDGYYFKIKRIVLSLISIFGVILIISTQMSPRADQEYIISAAEKLRIHDPGVIKPGAYLEMYHNQFGIVLFIYLLSSVFGDRNYIIFQFINLAALVIMYSAMLKIAEENFDKKTSLFLLLSLFLFFPMLLYVTFIYGTIISLSGCFLSLLFIDRFFRTGLKSSLILSLLFIGISVWLKQNALIFLIGIIIYCILVLFKTKIKLIMICAGYLLISIVCLNLPKVILENITQKELRDGGMPVSAFIAMGLQEGYQYDGWWNDFTGKTYKKLGYDSESVKEEAGEFINKKFEEFLQNPKPAIQFLVRKNISQWMNPDFESFWINWRMPKNKILKVPEWVTELFSYHFSEIFYKFLNILQFQIFLGTLLFVFSKNKSDVELCLGAILFGGFVFHTFWEAKCQYTIWYFLCLFPISASGWINAEKTVINYLRVLKINRASGIKRVFHKRSFFITICCCLLFIICSSNYYFRIFFTCSRFDEHLYESSVLKKSSIRFSDEDHVIYSNHKNDNYLCAEVNGSGEAGLILSPVLNDTCVVRLETRGDYTYLHFPLADRYIGFTGDAADGIELQLFEKFKPGLSTWNIQKGTDNKYVLFYNNSDNLTLTPDFSANSAVLSSMEDPNFPEWFIAPKNTGYEKIQ